MKNTLTALVGTGILLTSSAALAQQQGGMGWQGSYTGGPPPVSASSDNIGEEAQIVFSVDRMMDVAYDREDWTSDDVQSPYFILDAQEVKTTWHPVGI